MAEGYTIESYVAENGRAGIEVPPEYAYSLVALLRESGLGMDFESGNNPAREAQLLIVDFNTRTAIAVLAFADGEVIGFVQGEFFPVDEDVLVLGNAYVDEPFRERGIFGALVDRFDQEASRTSAQAIDASPGPDFVARTLQERHGYFVVPGEEDEIDLRKILKPDFNPATPHRK